MYNQAPEAGLASLLASRGRNGDSMLVHMAPEEVAGLRRLAMAHGGDLEVNPDTGLYQANFLKKILPMVIGAVLPGVPVLGKLAGSIGEIVGSQALGSALLVGGATALIEGDLKKGLQAGLGAYSGATLREGFQAAAAPPPQKVSPEELAKTNQAIKTAQETVGASAESVRAAMPDAAAASPDGLDYIKSANVFKGTPTVGDLAIGRQAIASGATTPDQILDYVKSANVFRTPIVDTTGKITGYNALQGAPTAADLAAGRLRNVSSPGLKGIFEGAQNLFTSPQSREAFGKALGGGFESPLAQNLSRYATFAGIGDAFTPEYEMPSGPSDDDTLYIPGALNPMYGMGAQHGRFLPGQYYRRTKRGLVPFNPYAKAPGYAAGGPVQPADQNMNQPRAIPHQNPTFPYPNQNYPLSTVTGTPYPNMQMGAVPQPQEIVGNYEPNIDPFTGEQRFARGGRVDDADMFMQEEQTGFDDSFAPRYAYQEPAYNPFAYQEPVYQQPEPVYQPPTPSPALSPTVPPFVGIPVMPTLPPELYGSSRPTYRKPEPVYQEPEPPVYQPPVYQEPEPPVYQPPVYQEPEPPVYQPPVYQEPEPPVYQPPVYQPPVYQEPEPPVYQPPVYQEPEPPVYQPPVYQEPEPPVYQPPVYQEPEPEPPVYQPPVYQPPVYQPPVYQEPEPEPEPPVYQEPEPKPPVYQEPKPEPEPESKPPVSQPPKSSDDDRANKPVQPGDTPVTPYPTPTLTTRQRFEQMLYGPSPALTDTKPVMDYIAELNRRAMSPAFYRYPNPFASYGGGTNPRTDPGPGGRPGDDRDGRGGPIAGGGPGGGAVGGGGGRTGGGAGVSSGYRTGIGAGGSNYYKDFQPDIQEKFPVNIDPTKEVDKALGNTPYDRFKDWVRNKYENTDAFDLIGLGLGAQYGLLASVLWNQLTPSIKQIFEVGVDKVLTPEEAAALDAKAKEEADKIKVTQATPNTGSGGGGGGGGFGGGSGGFGFAGGASATRIPKYSVSVKPVKQGGRIRAMQMGGAVGEDYNFGFAAGGLGSLPEYKAGGKLLNGPGDGMSDSIPAVIRGKGVQRAALADGEFVVPADVVSHLGNGSTKAGAKKLYAMMDRIRQARTGKTRQAPEVKADKYLPA